MLGLGTVRDAFSQMLHPGTSYIHTKMRYLIFLPWIFQRLEADRVTPGDFFRRLRNDEARLIDCLRHLGGGQGVIGYRAGRNLKRLPSSIYWVSLWDWGIRRRPLSLSEYAQQASAFGRYRASRDDDGNVTDITHSMWATLPPPPDDFLQSDIDFELRPLEAQILVGSIRRRHPQTLLASLCAKPEIAARYAYPWEVPETRMPERVAEAVRHARCFSDIMVGPQHTYNILVARAARRDLGRDTERIAEAELGRLRRWTDLIHNRRKELSDWVKDLPAFWNLLRHDRIPMSTRNFIAMISELAVERPEKFENDSTIHEQIRLRETTLKGKRARLTNRGALENWNGGAVGGRHEYRWSIAKGYLGEIAAALQVEG